METREQQLPVPDLVQSFYHASAVGKGFRQNKNLTVVNAILNPVDNTTFIYLIDFGRVMVEDKGKSRIKSAPDDQKRQPMMIFRRHTTAASAPTALATVVYLQMNLYGV